VKTTSMDPALLVGLDVPDDAAVYQVAPDVAIVQTVDFFTPVVDDAFAWGRIAAANALSDIYAMGARPVTALNLVGWPRALDFELLGRVLEGAGAGCEEAGVAVVGGHSVDDPEPKFGLSVTGLVDPTAIVRKTGAPPGSALVLTKPLGMGIISSGIKEGRASRAAIERVTEIMTRLNKDAADAMNAVGVSAATDVTGFGLIGHLLQMLDGLDARLDFPAIPVVQEAFDLASQGVIPGGSKRNQSASAALVDASGLDDAQRAVLFDAQTSGGLLIAVSRAKEEELLAALRDRGVAEAAVIGSLVEGEGRIEVLS
jgi:selenium donor protein